jgi:hypothetical protein
MWNGLYFSASFALLVSVVGVPAAARQGNSPTTGQPPVTQRGGPIAKDRDVEITLFEETRTRRGYAVPEAEKAAQLKIQLRILIAAKADMTIAIFLYCFLHLDPILDDTGKSLDKSAALRQGLPSG